MAKQLLQKSQSYTHLSYYMNKPWIVGTNLMKQEAVRRILHDSYLYDILPISLPVK